MLAWYLSVCTYCMMHIWHITKRFILQQIHKLIVKQKNVCEHHAEISPIQTAQAIINSIFQHTTFPWKKKSTDFAVYICVSTVFKKAVYTAQFLSSTPTHTHNTFKVAHLHIHKNIYDKTKRLDLVPNNQMIRGLPSVTVIHEIQEVFGTKLVTEKTWGVSFNVSSM